MIYVIEKVYDLAGKQIDSFTVAEFSTEAEANDEIDRLIHNVTDFSKTRHVWFTEAA